MGSDLVDAATPLASVSAFCQSVLAKLLPKAFLGEGDDKHDNWKELMRSVDRFVRCRRFENVTLHSVCQGIRLKYLAWLAREKASPCAKLCLSDMRKRTEILQELLSYVFDSILIPLLRSNFHITESSAHRHRLFYFRHDVWKALTESSLSVLGC